MTQSLGRARATGGYAATTPPGSSPSIMIPRRPLNDTSLGFRGLPNALAGLHSSICSQPLLHHLATPTTDITIRFSAQTQYPLRYEAHRDDDDQRGCMQSI